MGEKAQQQLYEQELAIRHFREDVGDAIYSKDRSPLSWQEATKLCLARNLTLQQAEDSNRRAQSARQRAFQRLVPRFFAFAAITKSIGDLASFSGDDFNFNVTTAFNIPNPVSFYAELYSIALRELQSQYALEMQKRQMHVLLYQLFRRSQQLEKEAQKIVQLRQELQFAKLERLAAQSQALQSRQVRLADQRERLRLSINKLFNTPGKNWRLKGPLPELSYRHRLKQVDFKKGFGAIGLKLHAIRLEVINASLLSAQARRLPNLNLALSAPQIYNSRTTDNFDFNPEDFRLFSGLSKDLDINDPLDRESLKDAQRRAQFSRQRLYLELESEMAQLEINKRTYQQLLEQRALLDVHQRQLEKSLRQLSPEQIFESLAEQRRLLEQIDTLEAQLTRLDLEFWIWDDQAWN